MMEQLKASGRQALDRKHDSLAIQRFEAAIQLETNGSPGATGVADAELHLDYAEALNLNGRYEEALEQTQKVLSDGAITQGREARARSARGVAFSSLGQHHEAKSELKTAFEIYQVLGDLEREVHALGWWAGATERSGDLQEALKSGQALADRLQKLGGPENLGSASYRLARLELIQERFGEAQKHLEEAHGHLDEAEDQTQRVVIDDLLGRVLFYAGDFERAEERWMVLLDVWRRIDRKSAEAAVSSRLAELALEREDSEQLLSHVRVWHQRMRINAVNAATAAYGGENEAAGRLADLLNRELGDGDALPPVHRAAVWMWVGRTLWRIGRAEEAENALQRASAEPPSGRGMQLGEWERALLDLGTLYLERRDYENASRYLRRSRDEFSKIGGVHFVRVAEDRLALCRAQDLDTTSVIASIEDRDPSVHRFGELIGVSTAMQAVFELLARAAESDIPLLIQGETGTGKDLAARAVHEHSSRRGRPFVWQNCSAVAPDLLYSELFGHRRGAFTGSTGDRIGLIESADGGTIFLDEISDATPEMQASLLRVLQEGEIRRIGENTVRNVNVRVIAATNRDLSAEVDEGRFRQDLYYRLRVLQVEMPALRNRPEDIPVLSHHLLEKAKKEQRKTTHFDDNVIPALVTRSWPGNVRELENEIRRVVTLVRHEGLISLDLFEGPTQGCESNEGHHGSGLKTQLLAVERQLISHALLRCGGNVAATARELRMSRSGLYRKIEQLGLRDRIVIE